MPAAMRYLRLSELPVKTIWMLPTSSPAPLRPTRRPCPLAMVQTNQRHQMVRFTNHLNLNRYLTRRRQLFYATNCWLRSVAQKSISLHGRTNIFQQKTLSPLTMRGLSKMPFKPGLNGAPWRPTKQTQLGLMS